VNPLKGKNFAPPRGEGEEKRKEITSSLREGRRGKHQKLYEQGRKKVPPLS